MQTVLIVLVVWIVISFPLAILVGKMIKVGQERHYED